MPLHPREALSCILGRRRSRFRPASLSDARDDVGCDARLRDLSPSGGAAEQPTDRAPSSRAAQDEDEEETVDDGGLTEDEVAPEGTAAQAGDRDCGDFDSQQEAQDFFEENGGSPDNNVDRLDADGDGEACEDFSFTADEGDDEPAPRGGIDTGLGGTAGERGRSMLGLMGLCLLGVSGALAIGRRRRHPRPTAR